MLGGVGRWIMVIRFQNAMSSRSPMWFSASLQWQYDKNTWLLTIWNGSVWPGSPQTPESPPTPYGD
uniref:Uncharacterized protein n=1 Tax=Picea glauca TaxID=3330 RepID=A0A101LUI3_PICGL|nr:hypothetical protein ABT39_MTgene2430 [Picea glauca]